MAVAIPTKTRADGQLSALAGEFFVAAELLKRGFQTSVTFGNAKAIDLLAHNPAIDQYFGDPKLPGIHPKLLQEFAEAWHYFDTIPAQAKVEL